MDNKQWEINYKNGLEINRYPFDALISFWFRNKHLITKKTNEKYKICELGCGCGNNLAFFAENDCEVYGIDISPTAIENAKKLFEKKKLKGHFFVENLINHPFENNYFDLVIDRGCFTHNPEYYLDCINIAYNILKKKGLFFHMLFGKNHSGLEESNKIINETYYFTSNKSHFWYNLPIIIFNKYTEELLTQKFEIYDIIECTNKDKKNYVVGYYHIYSIKQ